MLQRYSKENMEIEKMTLLEGLGCANSEGIVKLYLNRIFSNDEIIRKNQKFHAFSHLLSYNPDNVNRVWDYVKSNHERMSKILTNGYKDVLKYVKCITMRMNTPQQHKDLQKFIASNGHKFGQYRTELEVAEKELGELMTWDSVHVDEIARNMCKYAKASATRIIINHQWIIKSIGNVILLIAITKIFSINS
ncbi:uncharacterized protein LOC129787904 [Lutzomyia longipalpis]|uniref:uncharacterized protein LOC129787904 n=1 Tax=Lutzomyia longipalpis TaxID=7200 RepID=UPI0024836B66|nr:uncharacterized protein LOC129787904 [Lutzomyia longipalpis]